MEHVMFVTSLNVRDGVEQDKVTLRDMTVKGTQCADVVLFLRDDQRISVLKDRTGFFLLNEVWKRERNG